MTSSNTRSTNLFITGRRPASPPACSKSDGVGPLGVDSMALLVLLAAAARTGVVAADARLGPLHGRSLDLDAVDEHPALVVLAEERALAVLDLRRLHLVARDELHDARIVLGAALLRRSDLEPEPLRLLGPELGVLAVDLALAIRIVRLDDEIDVARRVRAVARAHQIFRGRR